MEGHIKLVDGPTLTEGRLMFNYKDHYGAVCDDGFDTTDANTVCHQLGFAGQETITGCCPYGRRPYGEIWLDDLGCTSHDVWLANCSHRGFGIEDCHPGEEVGVKCNCESYNSTLKLTVTIRVMMIPLILYCCGILPTNYIAIHGMSSASKMMIGYSITPLQRT